MLRNNKKDKDLLAAEKKQRAFGWIPHIKGPCVSNADEDPQGHRMKLTGTER